MSITSGQPGISGSIVASTILVLGMPRYYFMFSDGSATIEDHEGTELPDLAIARQEAAKDVEHLRQPRIGGRRSWAGWAVQVRDEEGALLCEVPFRKPAAGAKQRTKAARGIGAEPASPNA